ncbi:leader peptidase (prepilin peptidase) / N-methyltransferase [Anaerosphaera aminiphila DSM 21120]|uniref:Leader peptidase (Prepilin peptidase) / N-methyltransferase n=1 Tax=Anaerosphaera aminiphila DSM 21120 TaxID=1120995 RepID=A0A1M5RHZ4_9FIRM|nr:A24 family peptidase [Anaerosphaera aminiphila]SHH25788.1 leader peptidase (prepilin peptidase) / N-methyltransferase [Anaerosphaera aminiphila DSM 21120]
MSVVYIFIFILGAIAGSTIEAFIYRRNNFKSFVFGRSKCESCNHIIPMYYNIPIISYIYLRGKCKYCNSKISIFNFLCELSGGVLFALAFHKYGFNVYFLFRLFEIILLLLIAFNDLNEMYIHIVDVVLLFVVELLFKIYSGASIYSSIKPMILLFLFYSIIYILTKSVGEGDIVLGAVSGFFGSNLYEGFVIFRDSFIIAAIVSVFLMVFKYKRREDNIAFCPYIVIGILRMIL